MTAGNSVVKKLTSVLFDKKNKFNITRLAPITDRNTNTRNQVMGDHVVSNLKQRYLTSLGQAYLRFIYTL